MARTMQKRNVQSNSDVVETKAKKIFAPSDGIRCKSVRQGGLYFIGPKTGMLYSFSEYGDVTDIEYRDLAAAVRTKSAFIYNPYFVIDDEDFINEFSALAKYYEEQTSIKDLKHILDLSVHEMVSTIKSLPSTAVKSLMQIAATQVANGKLDSVKKIKALDELFGTDLNLIGEIISEQ